MEPVKLGNKASGDEPSEHEDGPSVDLDSGSEASLVIVPWLKVGEDLNDEKCDDCVCISRPKVEKTRLLTKDPLGACLFCEKTGHTVEDCDDVPRKISDCLPTFCVYCESQLHLVDECERFKGDLKRVADGDVSTSKKVTIEQPRVNHDSGNPAEIMVEVLDDDQNLRATAEERTGETGLSEDSDACDWSRCQSMSEESFEDESERPSDQENLEKSWLGKWQKSANVHETWVNAYRLPAKHAKFQIPLYRIQARIPAKGPRVYQILLKTIQATARHPDAGLKEGDDLFNEPQKWEQDETLMQVLAKIERRFGRLSPRIWRNKLRQVFNGSMPGYRWAAELAFTDGVGRYLVYRKITDFHASLIRARYSVKDWPSEWNPRSWVLVAAKGDISQAEPYEKYAKNGRRAARMHPADHWEDGKMPITLVELKIGSFEGRIVGSGAPEGFFEEYRPTSIRDNGQVVAELHVAKMMANRNAGLGVVQADEKLQILDLMEYYYFYFGTMLAENGSYFDNVFGKGMVQNTRVAP